MADVKLRGRITRPSFAGLPCQYRKAALALRKLTARKLTPIEIAARNASVSPKSVRDQLELMELAALDSITRGRGTWMDVQKLADASNIAGTMYKEWQIGGPECALAVINAEAAIINCAARLERTGRVGFTGEELIAVREMLSWAHAQRDAIDAKRLLEAIRLTKARIAGNHDVIDLNQACAALNGRGE